MMVEQFLIKISKRRRKAAFNKKVKILARKRSPADPEITFHEDAEYLSRFLRAIPDLLQLLSNKWQKAPHTA